MRREFAFRGQPERAVERHAQEEGGTGEFIHRATFHHPALVQDADVIANLLHFLEVMARKNDGAILLVSLHQITDAARIVGVEAGSRFIQKNHFCVADERLTQRHAFQHAVAQRAGVLFCDVRQSDEVQGFCRGLRGSRCVEAIEAGKQGELFNDGDPALKRRILREHGHALTSFELESSL